MVCGPSVLRVDATGRDLARLDVLQQFLAIALQLLEFENGTVGLAMNLDEETIGAVVLGNVDGIDED